MGALKDFREFALRGNVVDLAVGIIIGAAFGKIVSSLVSDIITPPIGLLIGGVDFRKLSWVLREAQGTNAAVTINYGAFLQTIFDFLIIAIALFLVIKLIANLHRKKSKEVPEVAEIPLLSTDQKLLTEIRDILSQQNRGA